MADPEYGRTRVDDYAVSGARKFWRFLVYCFAAFGLACAVVILILVAIGHAIIPGVVML